MAAFLAVAAFARCAAEQIGAAVALGAGTLRNGAGLAGFTTAGADRDAVTAAAFFALFTQVDTAAGGAYVTRFRAWVIGIAALVVFAPATVA